jgi:hypothetical protein
MNRFWRSFIEGYVNEPFYWFQAKGFTVSRGNLPILREKLRALERFEGRPRASSQRDYARALERRGLFVPKRAQRGGKDYPAIARMIKKVFDTLGVAWISEESIVEITEAGRAFLRGKAEGLAGIVESQLQRYIVPNPCIGEMPEGIGVFPYPTLLAVLSHFPEGIPRECYELFISRIPNAEEIGLGVNRIRSYIAGSKAFRRELLSQLERMPYEAGRFTFLSGGRASTRPFV